MASSRFSIEAVVSMIDRVSNPMGKASAAVGSFSTKTQAHFAKAEKSSFGLSNAIGLLGIYGGTAALAMGFKSIVTEASKMQNAIAMFTPILGGAENATKMVETLNDVAAKTPYQFEQLTGPTNMLIGLGGVLQNDVAKSLQMIGDLAGGSADHMQGIATVYAQVRSAGKMNLGDLMQFTNNGVPLLAQLAQQWGVTNAVAREMIKDKGTFTEVERALKAMTSEGGKFYNAMVIQSETFSGVTSTLADNISMTSAEIGMQLLPTLKELALSMGDVTGNIRQFVREHKEGIGNAVKLFFKILSIMPYLIAAYAAWKVLLISIMVITKISMALNYVSYLSKVADMMIISGSAGSKYLIMLQQTALWQKIVAFATTSWANAQKIINFLLFANPIGIIIIAVAALAYAIYDLYTNWSTYALQFNISIQNFVTGFARAKMEVYELLNAIGLISDKELTGAKLDFLQNFTTGVKLQTEQIRQNKAGGMASPVSNQIANGGGNVNGRLGIDINSNVQNTSMSQNNIPSYIRPSLNLDTGIQK